jgi:hypothetical protein
MERSGSASNLKGKFEDLAKPAPEPEKKTTKGMFILYCRNILHVTNNKLLQVVLVGMTITIKVRRKFTKAA